MKRGLIACALLSCLLVQQSGPAPAAEDVQKRNKSYVNLTVVGKLTITDSTASITAKGKPPLLDITFNLGFDKEPGFRARAMALNGRTVEIRGSLIRLPKKDNEDEPADDGARDDEDRRRVGHEDYVLVPVRIPVASSKPHYVNAVTRGEVQSGLLAVGGETTGVKISISPKKERMWELQLSPKDMELIEMAEDKAIIVSGLVTLQKGVAIPYRWIMQVRSVLLK
jgi:hypothetical protein